MPIKKRQNSESSINYYFDSADAKKLNNCYSIFTCFLGADCIDEQSYERRTLTYRDINQVASNKYGYRYNNIDTIFDICDSREHLEKHILSYLKRSEADKNKTLTSIINIHNAHWVAMIIAYRDNEYHAYYIDSSGHNVHPAIYKSLDTCNIHNIEMLLVKQQTDSYNCGLWALENAYYINNAIKNDTAYFNTGTFTLPYRDAEYFVKTRETYLFDGDIMSSQL